MKLSGDEGARSLDCPTRRHPCPAGWPSTPQPTLTRPKIGPAGGGGRIRRRATPALHETSATTARPESGFRAVPDRGTALQFLPAGRRQGRARCGRRVGSFRSRRRRRNQFMSVKHQVQVLDPARQNLLHAGKDGQMGCGHQNLILAEQHLGPRPRDQHPVLWRYQHVARRKSQAKGTGTNAHRLQPWPRDQIGKAKVAPPDPAQRLQSVVARHDQVPDGEVFDRHQPALGGNQGARRKAGHDLFNVGKGHRPDDRARAVKKLDRAVFRVHRIVDDIGQRPTPGAQIQRVKITGVFAAIDGVA